MTDDDWETEMIEAEETRACARSFANSVTVDNLCKLCGEQFEHAQTCSLYAEPTEPVHDAPDAPERSPFYEDQPSRIEHLVLAGGALRTTRYGADGEICFVHVGPMALPRRGLFGARL